MYDRSHNDRAPLKTVLGWVREGVAPPAIGLRDNTPGTFVKFYVVRGVFNAFPRE